MTALVSDIKLISPNPEIHGKLRAYVSCVVAGAIMLKHMRLYEGARGLFLSYPNSAASMHNNDYTQVYYPTTREFRTELEDLVIAEYNRLLEEEPELWSRQS